MPYYGEFNPEPIDTDVSLEGGEKLQSDGSVRVGQDQFPVFKVSKNDFYNNMRADRNRLRFESGSKAANYHQGTKYRNPFFIQFDDEETGEPYRRRIK